MDTKELFEGAATTARNHARRIPRDEIDAERDADHAQAKARGDRLRDIADWIAAESCMQNGRPLRADVFNAAVKVLAHALYGNVAVDMPARRV